MKIIEWISYEEMERRELKSSIGGMGGWVHGQQWPEYLAGVLPDDKVHLGIEGPRYEALRAAIVEGNIRCGGDEHQSHMVPVFDDNTVGSFSYRAWGDLMAAIWNTQENTNKYSYMDFYMSCLVGKQELKGPEDDKEETAGQAGAQVETEEGQTAESG